MAKPAILFPLILLSILFPISSPDLQTITLPSETIVDAVEILSDSGYLSMSLTLQLISQTLVPEPTSSLTLFAPSDSAFIESGQPPLSLLQYHFSPLKFSLETLKSLPFGTKIPTLFDNHSLVVTSIDSEKEISINNVTINDSVIYDVGSLVVYGVNTFFDPLFENDVNKTLVLMNLGCVNSMSDDNDESAVFVDNNNLEEKGYRIINQFLDMQFGNEKKRMTVFAPDDNEMKGSLVNLTDLASVFRRHVVPCKLTWNDLINLEDELVLPTYLKGFSIKMKKSGDVLVLNGGVPIVFSDVYKNENIAVHGIQKMLGLNDDEKKLSNTDNGSEFHSSASADESHDNNLDYGEF
ncbi:hypothetical protein IFM89_035753 [Coptis chinensis]|uniref:FAS1 domain-containing protein n=1 Tax=Coptis chinensis TaxID=261450 RepID=A0A835H7D2_9MAGN|nr:hypothetical protein IFM89_035753 [Coptis chinensis]